jgi:hypothetical protein
MAIMFLGSAGDSALFKASKPQGAALAWSLMIWKRRR